MFFTFICCLLALPVVWPQLDLSVARLFYRAGQGFFLADNVLLVALHDIAYGGARVLGVVFAVMILCSLPLAGRVRKGGERLGAMPAFQASSLLPPLLPNPPCKGEGIFFLNAKAWMFLLLALLIGPGLVANVGLKDHWGRARPREVVEFGGAAVFTPALEPHFERAHSNGSFVSGDGAFGFFLPSFAYVAPRRFSRRVFGATMVMGSVFGLVRIMMGAHFFSDVVYAAATMLATTAVVYAAMYGRAATPERWREWFGKE